MKLDFSYIVQIFRVGGIIRAIFLQKITEAFERDAQAVGDCLPRKILPELRENYCLAL